MMPLYGILQTEFRVGPQCSIKIYNPSVPEKFTSIDAIIDSGAAATCIPPMAIQKIGALVSGEDAEMGGANNTIVRRRTYYLGIELPDFEANLGSIRIISLPHRYAIIGRDILNRYKIALDGRQERWRLDCGVLCRIEQ